MKEIVTTLLATILIIFATVGILNTFIKFESPQIQTVARVKQAFISPKGTEKKVCFTLTNNFRQ